MEEKSCVFCQIVAKRIPARIVYEDDNFMAFLDIRPLNPGHTLLIPKKHYRWVYDVEKFEEMWKAVKKITIAIISSLNPISLSYATLGFEVPHAHVWIIPRFENDGHGGVIDWTAVKKIPDEQMDEIAKKIREKIPEDQKKVEEKKDESKEEENQRSEEEVWLIRRELELI
ncbi:MAG: HIT family protein [Candidatus Aenigmatarchaeota archaeon]